MTLISENPWPLVWICLAGAVVCLIALRFTQRGKFLIIAIGSGLLAGLLVVIDHLWVTDSERVEAVVNRLVDAARRSDTSALDDLISDAISLDDVGGREFARGQVARLFLRFAIQSTRFDLLTVGNLRIDVGQISRQAKADLRIFASGSFQSPFNQLNFATDLEGSDWSIGLEETAPGVWKIQRISALSLPGSAQLGWLRFDDATALNN